MVDRKLLLRLHCINDYIVKSNTGTPKEFALKLRISERQLYMDLEIMKKLGAPIAYSRTGNSYFYTREGCFSIGFDDFPPQKISHKKKITNELRCKKSEKTVFGGLFPCLLLMVSANMQTQQKTVPWRVLLKGR
ncbi:MAG: hypothetical protein ACK5NK_03975 [Niabella sp.]